MYIINIYIYIYCSYVYCIHSFNIDIIYLPQISEFWNWDLTVPTGPWCEFIKSLSYKPIASFDHYLNLPLS